MRKDFTRELAWLLAWIYEEDPNGLREFIMLSWTDTAPSFVLPFYPAFEGESMEYYAWCCLFDSLPYQEEMLDKLSERAYDMINVLPVGFYTDVQRVALGVRPRNFRGWFDTLLPFRHYQNML